MDRGTWERSTGPWRHRCNKPSRGATFSHFEQTRVTLWRHDFSMRLTTLFLEPRRPSRLLRSDIEFFFCQAVPPAFRLLETPVCATFIGSSSDDPDHSSPTRGSNKLHTYIPSTERRRSFGTMLHTPLHFARPRDNTHTLKIWDEIPRRLGNRNRLEDPKLPYSRTQRHLLRVGHHLHRRLSHIHGIPTLGALIYGL